MHGHAHRKQLTVGHLPHLVRIKLDNCIRHYHYMVNSAWLVRVKQIPLAAYERAVIICR